MTTELWADIQGHPDFQISTFGRVLSKGRWLTNIKGIKRYWKERILTSHENDAGYWSIVLDGCGLFIQVLVARAFIPNPENKPCVNHVDTNKSNNNVTNLEWATYGENMDHAHKNGLCNNVVGSNHYLSKLREEQIPDIVRSALNGESINTIAFRYGVTDWCIANIIKGRSWVRVSGIKRR